MKSYFLLILCIFSSYGYGQETASAIEAIIKREMAERKIPGLQIAVVKEGKVIVKRSFGVANVQDQVPVTDTTVFAINSCTKVFTGTAIMQLAEQGKVDLSAPVSRYLDDLPEQWQKVTIEQMMTHISGFPEILKLFDPATGDTSKTEKEIWDELKGLPMEFKTGEQFSYNQTNYYLLGKIINKLSGKSFDQFFKEEQFQKVGMPHTLFGDSRDVIPHFAPTYRYRNMTEGENGNRQKLVNDYFIFPSYSRTGAGLNSTAEDLAMWIIALQSGKLLKKEESLQRMWKPIKMNNGSQTMWSPGWGLTKFRTKHKAIGMSGGGRSAFLVYPDDHLAIIVLTNLAGSYPEEFLEELAGVYYPEIIKSDPVTYLRLHLKKNGFDKAIELVNSEKKKNPDFKPQEAELNNWGYRMMSENDIKNASEIFKLNVYLFPNSWNAYDSYGEALLKLGNKSQAAIMYRKSIDLNPDNEYGKKVLNEILTANGSTNSSVK